MNKCVFFLFWIILYNTSCANRRQDDIKLIEMDSSARKLSIKNVSSYTTIKKDSLFESVYNLVQLETTSECLIGDINRVSIYKNEFYLLDKKFSCVFVFDYSGKFKRKYSHIGGGPGEYLSLTDFGIDEVNENIILYSDRPKKIITYTLDDELVDDMSIDELLESIVIFSEEGKLLGINRLLTYEDYFITYNYRKRKKEGGSVPVEKSKLEDAFRSYKTKFPFLIRSLRDYCVIPYINTVYQVGSSGITKSYNLEFTRDIPDIESEMIPSSELISNAIKENQGFWLSNFREYSNWLTFSFGRGTKVFYAQDNDDYVMFDFVHNQDFNYFHSFHFSHDFYGAANDDGFYIFIEQALDFAEYFRNLKNEATDEWNKIGKENQSKVLNVRNDDNPILFVYRVKK